MPGISRLRRLTVVGLLFVLLAGDAVRYTVGWWGYLGLAGVLVVIAVVLLVRTRQDWRWNDLPYPLLAFLVLVAVSVAWSYYPAWSALGAASTLATAVTAIAIAVTCSWTEVIRDLGVTLRVVLGASIVFELFVAWVIRHPVLPLVPQPGLDYARLPDPVPPMYFWSRNELFDDGKIQGILGNSVLLGFAAILALIVFTLQLADGTVRRRVAIPWIVVATGVLVLTRSATAILALAAVATVATVILLLRRASPGRPRLVVGAAVAASAIAVGAAAFALRDSVLAVLGKSSDLTNRTEIWSAVIALAEQRPVAGWGWVSYWVPWIEPFEDLAFNNGVRQLHAHNAWLDVWLQLGILGLLTFGALVLSTLVRSWLYALDRQQSAPGAPRPYTALALLPLLLLVALLVQSVAESKLLVEYGLFLLAVIAVKTKLASP